MFKIGDRVKILGGSLTSYRERNYLHGKVGIIVKIDKTRWYPYYIRLDDDSKNINHEKFRVCSWTWKAEELALHNLNRRIS